MEGTTVTTSINSVAHLSKAAYLCGHSNHISGGIAISLERFMKLSFKMDVDGASRMNSNDIF